MPDLPLPSACRHLWTTPWLLRLVRYRSIEWDVGVLIHILHVFLFSRCILFCTVTLPKAAYDMQAILNWPWKAMTAIAWPVRVRDKYSHLPCDHHTISAGQCTYQWHWSSNQSHNGCFSVSRILQLISIKILFAESKYFLQNQSIFLLTEVILVLLA